jgi:hypothetical protein
MASRAMRRKERVSKKDPYATMQSAAMGGYGTDTAANVVRAGAVLLSVVVWSIGRRRARLSKAQKLSASRR